MKKQLAVGVDIGGTNSVFGFVDREGKILARGRISTALHDSAEELVKVLCKEIRKLQQELGEESELVGVGIGAPNGNIRSGCIEFAPNLKWKGIVPVANYFETDLGCPATLTNDAKAAALGEMLFGGAKGLNDFLFITLGTGLGSGIVVNGELVYGHDGLAGEMGHAILIQNGRLCGCGRNGCVETYCSASGIRRTYLEKSCLAPDAKIDSKFIYEKALSGDRDAMDSFTLTGEWLGQALANSVTYTSPSDIFLFGGLAQAGELIFTPTRKSFEENLLNIYRNKIKIRPSHLAENEAPILGAASLAWKKVKHTNQYE
jgi:glucokinase